MRAPGPGGRSAAGDLSAMMANTLTRSNRLDWIHLPVEVVTVRGRKERKKLKKFQLTHVPSPGNRSELSV
jgi:hypothetical protein